MERSDANGRSHVRWVVLFLLCLMYLITYLDRVSMANTAPLIIKEFGFSKVTMGVIFSAFIWSYSLFQVPGGWLGDRFGPRKVLSTIMTYRTVIAVLTTRRVRFFFFLGDPLCAWRGRSRRISDRNARHADVVPARRARLCAGSQPRRQPIWRSDRPAGGRGHHASLRLAVGLLRDRRA